MEFFEIVKMTSKGQVTVPASIREIFKLKKGSTVMFKITETGVFFFPCEIKEKKYFTQEEWNKIERLVAEKGRIYKSAAGAKKHVRSL